MTDSGSVADLFRLDGRVALVTGAGGAFGRVIARGFADMGASLFLTDLNSERLEESAQLVRASGATCATSVGDSGSSAGVDAAFPPLDGAVGRIGVLVHNSGRTPMQ